MNTRNHSIARRAAVLLLLACLFAGTGCGRRSETPPPSTTAVPTVTVTFPEGTTVLRVSQLLEENGVCPAADFLSLAQAGEYDAVSALDRDKRPFLAEGYLFPDTYEFYKNASCESALQKFLTNFSAKWTDEMQSRADALGMTRDETLTLASIIQTEAGYPAEMPHISSVLHNRLDRGMMLQCDVTYFYLEKTVMPYLCGDEWDDAVYEKYADLYYTYRFKGLPQGPICNPGIDAIEAALYPADTDDLYFVTGDDGAFYYAATHEEHVRNCEAAKRAD